MLCLRGRISLLIFLQVVISAALFGQRGFLDQSFGKNGFVVDSGTMYAGGGAIAIQSDGKIVLGGYTPNLNTSDLVLLRYHSNGTLDSSFGNFGKVVISLSASWERIKEVAVQSNGKILASFVNSSSSGIIRFEANGKIDSSFATQGILSLSDLITHFEIRPNGRILLQSGSALPIQYLPNGGRDSSFSIVPFPVGTVLPSGLFLLLPDGKMIMGAYKVIHYGNITKYHFVLTKYDEKGVNDISFGLNGLSESDTMLVPASILLQRDKSIVACGSVNISQKQYSHQVRYNADGLFDQSFGVQGRLTVGLYGSSTFKGCEQADGKLIFLINSTSAGNLLMRFKQDASLDTLFGKRGFVGVLHTSLTDFKLQPDGKILISGGGPFDSVGSSQYTLNRFLNNGQLYYNTIHFNIFIDKNGNGYKDANEEYYRNASVAIKNRAGDSIRVYSGSGFFSIDVDSGFYQIYPVNLPNYYITSPAIHHSSFSGYFSIEDFTFAVRPTPGIRDISISGTTIGNLRAGFTVPYSIVYKNEGTDTVSSGFIKFVKDSRTTFASSTPLPSSVVGDTITWSYVDLYPSQTRYVALMLQVAQPPIVTIGDSLCNYLEIFPKQPDIYLKSNEFHLCQVVRGAIDPNDKTETHGGRITAQQVADGDYLQYTIRFQNTGNDTAFNVYITDTLDSRLDWNSLRMVDASHSFQLNITDGRNCKWTFANINLVDSNTNEPLSHGYLSYLIKPKPNVQPGDVISNSAYIYFDYNLPEHTNTDSTKVVSNIYPLKLLSFSARRSGDKTNLLLWRTTDELNTAYFDVERSFNGLGYATIGRVRAGASKYTYTDNDPLKRNYYRLKMVDRDGRFTYSPVREVNDDYGSSVVVYPNPTKDNLNIIGRGMTQVSLLDYTGRVMMVKEVENGSAVLNVSSLARGLYVLRVKDVNGKVESRKVVVE